METQKCSLVNVGESKQEKNRNKKIREGIRKTRNQEVERIKTRELLK